MSPQDRKHGREAARRRAAQAAARAEAKRRQRRFRTIVAAAVAVVVVLAIVLATVPNDSGSTASSASTTTSPSTSAPPNDGPIADDPSENVSPPFVYGSGECPPAAKPATPVRTFAAAPKRCLQDGVDYKATIDTSEGAFTVDLLEDRAPGTVNNFVVLARWGYFDGLTFHRVVPGFVIQGGDPKGDGSGGPGYTIADELPTSVQSYKTWAVAMANAGPGTNGSQFFVCIDCSTLPNPGYSLFGQVIDGTDTVQAIDALGTGDGPPSKPVTITGVTILEG